MPPAVARPFVVAGEALVDIVVLTDGDRYETPGGSPANVAVGLARLGVPTLLLTRLGDDRRGQDVAAHLRASGVVLAETSAAAGGTTSTATARLGSDGAATYDFDLSWDLPSQRLPDALGLHVGSLGTLLEPGREAVLDLVRQAAERGVFVSYDPNVRPALVDDPADLWPAVRDLASMCTLVKASDEDLTALRPGESVQAVAEKLLRGDRTELVLVTLGARGARAHHRRGTVDVAAPKVTVADTVGAGDAFTAGALAALTHRGAGLESLTLEQLRSLLVDAMAVAAVTCSRRGANPPTRRELPTTWPELG